MLQSVHAFDSELVKIIVDPLSFTCQSRDALYSGERFCLDGVAWSTATAKASAATSAVWLKLPLCQGFSYSRESNEQQPQYRMFHLPNGIGVVQLRGSVVCDSEVEASGSDPVLFAGKPRQGGVSHRLKEALRCMSHCWPRNMLLLPADHLEGDLMPVQVWTQALCVCVPMDEGDTLSLDGLEWMCVD